MIFALIFHELIAQIQDMSPLLQFGIAGIMLGWFMFIVTPALRSIERSQDWTTKAVLMLTLGLEEAGMETKRQAKELLAQIELKEKKRDKDQP